MTRPHMQWNGSDRVKNGEAVLWAGDMHTSIPMNSCDDALKIQKLLDKAYIDGARDALMNMEGVVSTSMSVCRSKW